MKIVTEARFKSIEAALKKKGIPYHVEQKRNTVVLIQYGKVAYQIERPNIALRDLPIKERYYILSIISRVKQQVTKYLKNNPNYEIIRQRHNAAFRNRPLFDRIDEDFWEVDIKHCFWRIAYLRGYINEKLYMEVLGQGSRLKIYRNMALSCIVAPKMRASNIPKKETVHTIEDTTAYKHIYDNIRLSSYNMMGDIMYEVGENNVITYRTDGIFVTRDVLARVCKRMRKNGMFYNIRRCTKVGEKEIKSVNQENPNDVEIRRF
jgi:hypothetical protein